MKILIIVFILTLLLPITSAYQLGVSPIQIEFKGTTKQQFCKNVTIISEDYNGTIIVEDRWAKPGVLVRDIRNHNLSAQDNNLTTTYNKEFVLIKQEKFPFCISAKETGTFHGILLFKTSSGNVQVGNWIIINVTGMGNSVKQQNNSGITGSIIQEGKISPLPIWLFITTLLLLFLLALLLKTSKLKSEAKAKNINAKKPAKMSVK